MSRKETLNCWKINAKKHYSQMEHLLYPPKDTATVATIKERMHAVHSHPIYNFLHTYYRYSAMELKMYSPGIDNVNIL